MRPFRPGADGPLLLLALLALALLGSLASFVANRALPFDLLVACETLAATLLARMAGLGLLLPAGLVAASLLAALLSLAHQVWATRRMLGRVLQRRRTPDRELRRLARALGLDGRLDLVDDATVFTFCHGLLRPRVCLSRGLVELLEADELRAVLAHEAHHLRHRDPIKILLGRSLASALFFLPLAGGLRSSYLAGKELSADRAAGRAGGELPLASALLKMLAAERPRWPAGVLAIGALTPTEARLVQLVEKQPLRPSLPPARDWLSSALLASAIFGFAMGSVAAAEAAPVHAACAPSRPVALEPAPAGGRALPEPAASVEPDRSTSLERHRPIEELLAPRDSELLLPEPRCELICDRPLWQPR